MKHPMRTLLYDLLVAPLVHLWQQLFDLIIPIPGIGPAERVPVPQGPWLDHRRDDLRGLVRPPREPEW